MTLLAVDGQNLLHRSLTSKIAELSRSDDAVVGGVIAFVATLGSLIGRYRPITGVVVFDGPGRGFRRLLSDRYKGGREERSFDASQLWQIRAMMCAVRSTGLAVARSAPVEADDVLAATAWASGGRVVVATDDKDLGFLVQRSNIRVHQLRDRNLIGPTEVREKWGVDPHMVPHLQALAGDGGDGVGGLRGVGKALAAEMLRGRRAEHVALRAAHEFSGKRWKEHASAMHDVRRMRDSVAAILHPDYAAKPGELSRDWALGLASVLAAMESRRHLGEFCASHRIPERSVRPHPELAIPGYVGSGRSEPVRKLF